jgi:hypothetical protein
METAVLIFGLSVGFMGIYSICNIRRTSKALLSAFNFQALCDRNLLAKTDLDRILTDVIKILSVSAFSCLCKELRHPNVTVFPHVIDHLFIGNKYNQMLSIYLECTRNKKIEIPSSTLLFADYSVRKSIALSELSCKEKRVMAIDPSASNLGIDGCNPGVGRVFLFEPSITPSMKQYISRLEYLWRLIAQRITILFRDGRAFDGCTDSDMQCYDVIHLFITKGNGFRYFEPKQIKNILRVLKQKGLIVMPISHKKRKKGCINLFKNT